MVRKSRNPFCVAQRLSETMPDSALVNGTGTLGVMTFVAVATRGGGENTGGVEVDGVCG